MNTWALAWYRKHFKLPAGAADGKVFIEFEGLKQAGHFCVNGKPAGIFENGITPCGIDITKIVNFGDKENVIAVKVDNSNDYEEDRHQHRLRVDGPRLQSQLRRLQSQRLAPSHRQGLPDPPLYENLQTTGVYVYPSNILHRAKTCDVNVESQVRNERTSSRSSPFPSPSSIAGGSCAHVQIR